MADDPKQVRARAERRFTKASDEEKAKAMADYQAEGRAMRERSAQLKELRLAKEAADEEADSKKKKAAKPKPAKPAAKKAAAAKKK